MSKLLASNSGRFPGHIEGNKKGRVSKFRLGITQKLSSEKEFQGSYREQKQRKEAFEI